MIKGKIKRILLLGILILCSSIYPIIFLYCKNIAEISFEEISKLLLIYCLIGFAIWGGCAIVIRQMNKSAISAFLFIAFLANYMLVQDALQMIMPNLKYWHIVPLALFLIVNVIYWVNIRIKDQKFDDFTLILTMVMAALLILNFIPAIPKIIEKNANQSTTQAEQSEFYAKNGGSNIYWMIFDECASFPTIEKYYNYTDKSVYNYLTQNSFTVSDTSHNECGNTVVVLTNCLNLDYVANTSMDATELSTHRENPALYRLLNEQGYTINGIGDTAWLGVTSINSNQDTSSQTVEGYSPTDVILQHTIIAPFRQFDGTQSAKLILDSLEYAKNSSNFIPNSSTFNLMYICSPHQPFLFDENGRNVQAVNYNNWSDDKYYLGQYRFIMNQIVEIVDSIKKNDPDSVIIIESDHGPRFKEGMHYEDKLNILNAVYYKGENIDEIKGKSGVNTLRAVFNRLFGYEFEDLEVKESE